MNKKGWEELFKEAIRLHEQGVEGDEEAVKKAYLLLKKIRNMVTDNNLVEAYYGSSMTLLGRDAVDPMERTRIAKKGLKILDEAVSKEPENTDIRTLRAFVCSRIPEKYFHRTSTAVEDFSHLVTCYEQGDRIVSEKFYWKLLYELGVAYKNLGKTQEANSTWEKLLSKTTDPMYKDLISKQ